MLVSALKVLTEPVRHFEEYAIDNIKISLCSRPRIIIGYKKPRKRYWIFGETIERPLYARGRAYQLELTCDPPQELPVAFAELETAAKKYDLPLERNFIAIPADMRTLIQPWKMWTAPHGGASVTALMTIIGRIQTDEVRDAFDRYARQIAEPHPVNSGYHTVNPMTGKADVTKFPYIHCLQRWSDFSEARVMRFSADILETARMHRDALGAWDVSSNEALRKKHGLPPYLKLRGSFAARRQDGQPRFFHFEYFYI